MKKFKLLFFVWILMTMLSCDRSVHRFEYASRFYKIGLVDTAPFLNFFSVDGLGESRLDHNPVQWQKSTGTFELRKISDRQVALWPRGNAAGNEWLFSFAEDSFSLTSTFRPILALEGFEFRFSKNQNHTTLLGIMTGKNKTRLPAVLHLPDMGTFQITADQPGTVIHYDASRKEGEHFIQIRLPAATAAQGKVTYTFAAKSIYPRFPQAEQPRYAGFRRNYLNLFQINPKLQVIANNSCSDPCAFTLFLSSMLALKTPALVDSLTALDILKMSVERYLNGMKAYGMFGYNGNWEDRDIGVDNSKSQPYDYLDTYPSLVISACNYIKGSGDIAWAGRHYEQIKAWMDRQMKRDYDGNGLVEYELSGNSGSWNGVLRPANWWDTIGFGHEDAFSNALTYEALKLMTRTARLLSNSKDAGHYDRLAQELAAAYYPTFYNPKTGVLAGWKSRDGKLHDYYFVMVNSMAVYYNLVPQDKIKTVMQSLWQKMVQVGFTDFTLGLPGNLISVRKEDYTHPDPRWGGGEREDGSDAFQRYENGGASLNWSYFTLKAFKKAGLDDELEQISRGLLSAVANGSFQGSCETGGMTKDWKTWSGDCWGYEGFLCDGYLALLAFNPEDE
jgi:hypothetical protein